MIVIPTMSQLANKHLWITGDLTSGKNDFLKALQMMKQTIAVNTIFLSNAEKCADVLWHRMKGNNTQTQHYVLIKHDLIKPRNLVTYQNIIQHGLDHNIYLWGTSEKLPTMVKTDQVLFHYFHITS